MANWPGTTMTLPETIRVGCVQYFLKHTLSVIEDGRTQHMEHIFAYVMWKKLHSCFDYFGKSAIVNEDEYDTTGPNNFIPVQRITHRCAHTRMKLNLQGFNETVYIVCPIAIKHSS